MELKTKKFYLVWRLVHQQKKKVAKSGMATDAPLHHMSKTRTIYSKKFETK
jgi:hypothetical protein